MKAINRNGGYIIHLTTGNFISPVHYDKSCGEVSYISENSSCVFTCFDYELKSTKGFNHLKKLLDNLSKEELIGFNSVTKMERERTEG